MLKNSFTPRLLKKVQMQGGAPGTHPQDGCRCEAWCSGTMRVIAVIERQTVVRQIRSAERLD